MEEPPSGLLHNAQTLLADGEPVKMEVRPRSELSARLYGVTVYRGRVLDATPDATGQVLVRFDGGHDRRISPKLLQSTRLRRVK